jgi:hypothetical protein
MADQILGQHPDRAGGSLDTLHVPDVAVTRDQLAERGITIDYDDTTSTKVKFGQVSDPGGNAVTEDVPPSVEVRRWPLVG